MNLLEINIENAEFHPNFYLVIPFSRDILFGDATIYANFSYLLVNRFEGNNRE